jgi:hypothetical protein
MDLTLRSSLFQRSRVNKQRKNGRIREIIIIIIKRMERRNKEQMKKKLLLNYVAYFQMDKRNKETFSKPANCFL